MYNFMKKEENLDAGNIMSGACFSQTNEMHRNQKPSPITTDEGTKEETITQNTSEVTSFAHKSRFARKSGLKPIRPGAVSTSALTAVTPAKPHTQNFTSSFKENEPIRSLQFDKPYTPKSVTKFLRSESTPELNRFRKSSKQLLMSTDKTNSILNSERKRNEHSSCYTLSTAGHPAVETIPDIFCKPLIQTQQAQQSDSVFNYKWKPCSLDEKMSKWGYGPSVTDGTKAEHHKEIVVENAPAKVEPEEIKIIEPNQPANRFNKWTAPVTVREQPVATVQKMNADSIPTFSRTIERPSFSLGSSQITQNTTIKENIAPHKHLEQDSPATASALPAKMLIPEPATTNTVMKPPPIKLEKPLESKKETVEPPVVNVEPPQPVPVSVAPPNLPANRPPTKGKQIVVNGKTFTVMKPLGRGGSSVVYQVLNAEMTDMFALKVVRLDSVDEVTAEGYINEVRLLKQLQGLPRVVRLVEYEYDEREEKLLLVMEKGDTDFASVIRSRSSQNSTSTISPALVRFYWQEMLEAVGSIHDKNVVHSDLKPANFLLVNGGLKLIDFGIAASIQSDMTSIFKDTQCGTCNYMAPEAIKSHSPAGAAQQEYKINKKTDVWSLGCILYNLIYKNPPFHKIRDTFEKLNAIVDDKYVIDFPPGADPLAVDVLRACLDRNPVNRPTIAQLLSHPYLTYSCPTVHSQSQEKFAYLHTVLAPLIENGKLHDDVKEWLMKLM